ncbi:MAG: DNA mismatch repair protein MutS [Eubacteriales bacterium]|nr:DNA mismatch repair protein MutS [Eubacteriales bacterium]
MNTYYQMLEFPAVLAMLKECAVTEAAKQEIDELCPILNEAVCCSRMAETTAARQTLDTYGSPPLVRMKGLAEAVSQSEIGSMLAPEQLTGVAQFASACKRMIAYLLKSAAQYPEIASYMHGLEKLEDLQAEIERCVGEDRVYDEASSLLRDLRRKILFFEGKIKEKLNQILQSQKKLLADGYITRRGGHYVVPVQSRYQSQFDGRVIDTSSTGATVFMEPKAITTLQAELSALMVDEDAETRRILYTLSALVAEHAQRIRRNQKTIEKLDFLFAKAKLSAAMGANAVHLGSERRISIRQGRHPLLNRETCVPLDFIVGEATRGVIITGPNTGGKTVTLKTVGLLSLMAQCGLHIPCEEDSFIAIFDGYWCDIGDSQDISQNLSTFSGHMTNVIRILENASRDSLVLLDELGSGTDPAEGMGIAIAVLEELRRRDCLFLATTHYPQVKTYAENAVSVQSARMAFDQATLAPLYRLEMGKSGESCALHIASRLGLAPHLLARARHEVYGTPMEAEPVNTGMTMPRSKLIRATVRQANADIASKFCMGDSVVILPEKESGIVYKPADEHGDVIVQVMGEKRKVRHTHILLRVPAAELYPPDYDFSVIFDSVENRKASRILSKRYDPSVVIVREKEELY